MTAPSALTGTRQRTGIPKLRGQRPVSGSVRRAAAWSLGGTVVFKVLSIAVTAIVARILTQQDFGEFAVATTVYTIVSALGGASLTMAITRADLHVSEIAPTMWSFSLGINGIVAAALVVFAEPIAEILGSPHSAGPVRVMAIVAILDGLSGVPTAQLYRDFKQKIVFWAGLIGFIPTNIVLVIVAKAGGGAMAFAWSRVVGTGIVCFIVLFSVSEHYFPWLSKTGTSVLFRFAIPFTLATLIGYLLQNVDYAFIGHLMGSVMLGTYVLAFNAASWPSALMASALGTVAISAFSSARSDPDRLIDKIVDGFRAVLLIAAPMSALEMVLSKPLVLTLYGSHWISAVEPLEILTLYGTIAIICTLFSQMLAALGQSKFVLTVQIVWLSALVPAMAIGVRAGGIVGAAFAHICIIVPIVMPCYLTALKRATGIRISALVKASAPVLIAAGATGAIAWCLKQELNNPAAQLFVGGGVGSLFYIVVTAPQMIVLIGRGKVKNPKILKFMRTYYHIGRSLGLRVGPGPRHARLRRFHA